MAFKRMIVMLAVVDLLGTFCANGANIGKDSDQEIDQQIEEHESRLTKRDSKSEIKYSNILIL